MRYILLIVGTILGAVIMRLLDVQDISAARKSTVSDAKYLRSLKAENARLHNVINSYQINNACQLDTIELRNWARSNREFFQSELQVPQPNSYRNVCCGAIQAYTDILHKLGDTND